MLIKMHGKKMFCNGSWCGECEYHSHQGFRDCRPRQWQRSSCTREIREHAVKQRHGGGALRWQVVKNDIEIMKDAWKFVEMKFSLAYKKVQEEIWLMGITGPVCIQQRQNIGLMFSCV